jgi:hypothetical protein
MASLRSILANLLVASVSVGLTLLLGEGVVRLVLPDWVPSTDRLLWSHDETLGWAHPPGMQGRHAGWSWDVAVRINGHGLRDVEHDYGTSSRRRVLILGDSFGWGFGVEQEDTISARLGERCPDSEIINASVPGYGTDQQYLYWRDEGQRYSPDVVVLMVYVNDFLSNDCDHMMGYPKPRFVLRNGALELVNTPVPRQGVIERSYTWLAGSSALASLFFGVTGLTGWVEMLGCDAPDPAVTVELVRRLSREVRHAGSSFRLLLVPWEEVGGDKFVEFFRAIGSSAKVRVIDLAPVFTEARSDGTQLTLDGDYHWNAAGHDVAAGELARHLLCDG